MRLPAYAIVIAGGYGTRFWPASRRARPKQFLPLVGKQSLLQQTYRRLRRIFPPGRIYVVGSAEHRRLLRQQLPHVPTGRLLLEPVGRNTAAAIALAAEHIRREPGSKPDAVLAVFPADHAIQQEARFLRIVRAALKAAADEDRMIVLGIPPTHPHTGYGYIERSRVLKQARGQEVFAVKRFTEKPDRRTATRYLRTRRYYWNAGMFFWRLSTFNRLLTRHLPRTRQAMDSLARSLAKRNYTASLSRAYRRLQNISLDYALAEPAAARGQVRLLECAAGWSDLGSWSAAYDWQARKGENVTAGPHFLLDAHGNWLEVPGKFVAAIGMDNLVVVETPDALLLCPRERAQEVGKVVDYLRKKKAKRWL